MDWLANFLQSPMSNGLQWVAVVAGPVVGYLFQRRDRRKELREAQDEQLLGRLHVQQWGDQLTVYFDTPDTGARHTLTITSKSSALTFGDREHVWLTDGEEGWGTALNPQRRLPARVGESQKTVIMAVAQGAGGSTHSGFVGHLFGSCCALGEPGEAVVEISWRPASKRRIKRVIHISHPAKTTAETEITTNTSDHTGA